MNTTPKAPTIEEIEDEWKKDSPLSKSELVDQALEVDYLHGKYLGYYRLCKEQKSRLYHSLNKKKFETRDYYDGKAPAEVYKDKPFDRKVMKSDLDKYVDVDPEVTKISLALEKVSLKVELLESILKQITYRGMNIKTAIAYIQFLNGD
jgi:hypothetical protein